MTEQLEVEIGDAAGKIWNVLYEKGPMSRASISKATKLSTNLVNQGIGWLAREGKLATDKAKRGEVFLLK